jgi:NTE family protein
MLKAGVLNGLSVGFRCGSADAITKVAPFLANFGTVLVPCSLRMSDPLGSMLRCSNGLPTFGIHNTRPGLHRSNRHGCDENQTNNPAAGWRQTMTFPKPISADLPIGTRARSQPVNPARDQIKQLSLALQGGGAFGAFTWGVLDRLLEEEDLALDAISGASAGAINAVLLASGLAKGGPDEARASLERFWSSVGASAPKNLFLHPELVVATAGQLSPYQFNPLELNPLRDLLAQEVDFEAIRTHSPVRLLVSATRVQDGAVRVFRTKAISLDVVLASACLPRLHHAVDIHGEPHWDGGYAANPPVIPLVGASRTSDVLLVQLIPTDYSGLPVTKSEIDKRLGQITFNAPLQKELEAIGLMKKLVRKEGAPTSRLGRKIDSLQLHHLFAEDHVHGLSQASVLNTDWSFLTNLRDQGRAAAEAWLANQSERYVGGLAA